MLHHLLALLVLSMLVLTSCAGQPSASPTVGPSPRGCCGDGVCDGPEDPTICPQDCAPPVLEATATHHLRPTTPPLPTPESGRDAPPSPPGFERVSFESGPDPNTYWVVNPTSGVKLWVEVIHPSEWSGAPLPTLVLVPGGTDDSSAFTDGRQSGQHLADDGYVVVAFDADGRGRSSGAEDQCGYIHQDGLVAVLHFAALLPEVDPKRIALSSYSYGVTMCTGALARHPDVPVLFYIDWEGPANRDDTGGCDEDHTGHLQGHPCDDEEFWREREASAFATRIRVPYQRLQTASDHAQPDVDHALLMIANATDFRYGGHGVAPWTRLNDVEPNTVYTAARPPDLPARSGNLMDLTSRYAAELFELFSDSYAVPVVETPLGKPGTRGDAPLFFAPMTHMEGGHKDDEDRDLFTLHVEQLRYGMDLAEEYGAKLTIESERPFAIACRKWNLNLLQEVIDRGHGVGTHGDVGFGGRQLSQEQLAQAFADRKALVDSLVGSQSNRGISGGGGPNDWVLAAHEAGFKYVDGIVGMHYMSMPLENRPDAGWTDEFIRAEGYHDAAPVDFAERIHPVMLADARDFVPDENGVVLCSSGETGHLAALAEAQTTGCRGNQCVLTNEDVDAIVDLIMEADRVRDRSRIAKLTVLIPAPLFVPRNEEPLRYFFSQLGLLEDEGILTWATQGEVYDAYVAWSR
jgi:pimeloyl-ACP methyl ester carboxylesterase